MVVIKPPGQFKKYFYDMKCLWYEPAPYFYIKVYLYWLQCIDQGSMYPTFFHSDGIFMVCFVSSPKRNPPPPHSAASNESYTSISLSPLVGINSLIYYLFFVHTQQKSILLFLKRRLFTLSGFITFWSSLVALICFFMDTMRQKKQYQHLTPIHHTLLG